MTASPRQPSWLRQLIPLPLLIPALLSAGSGAALELNGQSLFVSPPWDLNLITYNSDTWSRPTEYYLTVVLPERAGADLGALTVRQIRGSDWNFPFFVEQTRAFIGVPRREGKPVAVEASFSQEQRRFTLRFPQPVAPGQVLTVVLKPWANPSQADVYQFDVVAFAAGPNPQPSPVGIAELRIYDNDF